MYINMAIMSLTQLGVGPETGFIITSDTETWSDFIGDKKDIEGVRTFIYLKVRLVFDPPTTSFLIEAMERQIRELEWRLNIQADKPVIETTVEGGTVSE
jgi:hypothetical protein